MFITEYFKIRRKTDGKFSLGGATPYFNHKGKYWKSIGDVKLHLSVISLWNLEEYMKDTQLVRYKLIDLATGAFSMIVVCELSDTPNIMEKEIDWSTMPTIEVWKRPNGVEFLKKYNFD